MKMTFGKIVEGFAFLPSLNLNWLVYKGRRFYHVQFAWLFWYVSIFGKEVHEWLNA